MFVEIIKYGFLVIFFVTAIIGLASIPEWIKIPEWYRKRIFIILVIEVIGVIIIISKNELIENGPTGVPSTSISDNNWVALNDKGVLVKPEFIVETNDTTIKKRYGYSKYLQFKNLNGEMVEDGLSIVNKDNGRLGLIKNRDLKENGLFNSFLTFENEVSAFENNSLIKWEKYNDGNWNKRGNFMIPYKLQVADRSGGFGTFYTIVNTEKNDTVFDSRDSSKPLFNRNNRINHFYEYKNAYYILRISEADLRDTVKTKYVDIIYVRLKPTVKGNTPANK